MIVQSLKQFNEECMDKKKDPSKIFVVELQDIIQYLKAHKEDVDGTNQRASYKLDRMIGALEESG